MKIYLRPISIKDTSLILLWRNSEKVREHCFSKEIITEESHKKYFEDFIISGKRKQFIVERVDEEFGQASYPIATVYLKDMDCNNKRCELCIFTSDDLEWNAEGQSIAITMLLEKAFNEYGMHKVYSYVFYKNSDEVELMKSAGFSVEAIFKEESMGLDGNYEDVIRLSIFKDSFI